MQQNYSKYFDEEGHLNTIARTLYADAMRLSKVEQLPEPLQQHIVDCSYCSSLIVILYDAISDLDYEDLSPHPVLETTQMSKWSISENPQDIEGILEQLMAEAIEIPSMERLLKKRATYRKSGAVELKIKKPIANALCFNELDFEFETPLSSPTDLSIRNHKGRLIKILLPVNTTKHSVPLQPQEKYPNGLYYWKLSPINGQPLVGKFYVYHS